MLADLRFALRLLLKSPGTSLAAVAALALGIGLSTAIFNVFSSTMLRPFPHVKDEDRIVFLSSQHLSDPDSLDEMSMPDFLDLRAQSRTLWGFTTFTGRTMILPSGATPERILGADISAEAFTMLGVEPVRGRVFEPADAEAGATPVAILSYGLWQRRYGGKDDAIGKVEVMNGKPTTIVGVMPQGFTFPDRHEMWTPLSPKFDPAERASHSFPAFARLRDGATLEQAQAELATLAARFALEHKLTNEGKGFAVRLLRQQQVDPATKLLMRLMLGATLFVLLIACANVANLLLAQSAARSHEVAIRLALGATRGRIVRQVLTESLLLGIVGGALGLLVALWADGLLARAVPSVEIPYWLDFSFDWRVFAFAATASLVSALVFGSFPALQAGRATAVILKEGARAATPGRHAQFLRRVLVVVQVALSAVLLIGAGLFVRSYLKLQSAPPGYDAAGVLTFRVGLPPSQYTDKAEVERFFDELTPALAGVPGVVSVGATGILPTRGNNANAWLFEGEAPPAKFADAKLVTSHNVTRDYLATMRIPLLRGRGFAPADTRTSPLVAVVDQQFVDRWCDGRDPIGRRLTFGLGDAEPKWIEIVGVVGNAPLRLEQPYVRGGVYLLVEQSGAQFLSYAVRVDGDPTTYGRALQRAVQRVKPGIPIYDVHTMRYLEETDRWHFRFFGQVFSAFGLSALFLAALGVYSVVAYSVAQRTAEIGVRMALGASSSDVLRLVGRQGFVLVATGLGVGLVVALAVTRLLGSILYGVSPSDPPTYFVLTLVLAAVGLLACWIPARRATRVDPCVALRGD
jgi:putative ABC transport system permease protein